MVAFVTFLGWRLGRMSMSINRTRMGPGLGKAMDDMAVQLSKKMRSKWKIRERGKTESTLMAGSDLRPMESRDLLSKVP